MSSSCTDICKGGPVKSYAKIVLVTLSQKDSANLEVKTYAIIDDQRNAFLIGSDAIELLDFFEIKVEVEPNCLK